jgi:hypothetical protein
MFDAMLSATQLACTVQELCSMACFMPSNIAQDSIIMVVMTTKVPGC